MATFTASAVDAVGIQPKGIRVGLVAVAASYSVLNTLSIGSTIQMVKVPQGATPLFVSVGITNAGQQTLSVGDGLSNARYKADGTASSGMGMITANPAAATYTYSTDDTIDIFVSLVSIGTLGGAYFLRAIFSMDTPPGL